MSTQATARLQKELKDLIKSPVSGIKVEAGENLFEWIVYIQGPQGTPYEKGIYKAVMNFPPDYPNSPPSMKFVSEFWHPNVYANGGVCISILHTPDPLNPEESDDLCWRPIHTVESILVSVVSMLSDPNFSSPANVDASVELRKNPTAFEAKVRKLAEKAKSELPPGFEMPKPKAPVKEVNPSDDFFDDYIDELEEGEEDEEEEEEEDEEEN